MPPTSASNNGPLLRSVLAISLLYESAMAASLPSMSYAGCFSSSQPMNDQGSWTYQTQGYCQPICVKQNQAVLGLTGGSDCWCGDQLPPASSKVADSNCNTPCQGFPSDMCGGTNFWTVYLTGTESSVPNFDGQSDSNPSSPASSSTSTSSTSYLQTTAAAAVATTPATTASPSVVTSVRPGQTIVVTEPASQNVASSSAPSATSSSKHGGGTNVGGIAAGVVVGVIAIAAIIAGLIFWQRRKRRQAAEEEYNRSTQVNEFMRAGSRASPPTAYSNISDSRLDPEAGNRRNSQGSIADAEDYSRRILRVANPDG